LEIKKRDGSVVPFKQEKITLAIFKAAQACGGNDFKRAEELCAEVVKRINNYVVEDVQNLIEKVLMERGHTQTARAFILYREKHKQAREKNALIGATIGMFNDYLDDQDWRIQENANSQKSVNGLNNYVREAFTKNYWLHEIYPNEIRQAHEQGDFHIHDLGLLAGYCSGWDLQQLLRDGFGVEGKERSNPAKHLRSFLGQILNSTLITQGECSGAQAWTSFDTFCAPFIRYDNLTYKQVKQSLQEFVFSLNLPSRVGFQAAFSNVTVDITCPKSLCNTAVIIGGEMQQETYGMFQEEMDIFNKAFCEVMLEGDAKGAAHSYPIPTLNITKTFPWESEAVEAYMKLACKYGSPYLSNYINSDNDPDDAVSMCPLAPNTKVLIKNSKDKITSIEIERAYNRIGKLYKTFHKGGWYDTSFVRVPISEYVRITLINGQIIEMDVNHLQPSWNGNPDFITNTVKAEELKEGMWLPFNVDKMGDEKDSDYLAGYAVGCYMGDGFITNGGVVYCLSYTDKKIKAHDLLKKFWEQLGCTCYYHKNGDNARNLCIEICNQAPKQFIENFVGGSTSLTKYLKNTVWSKSNTFHSGILDGWFATDGGSKNRLETSSKLATESFSTLCTLLGSTHSISEGAIPKNYGSVNKCYTCRKTDKEKYPGLYHKWGDYKWIPIKSIDLKRGNRNFYCAVVDSPDHLFTLSSGLITHNCRLRLSTKELKKRGGGLFGSNPLTGSIGVVTLNLPRAAKGRTPDEFLEQLKKLSNLAKDSLEIKRKIIEEQSRNGLYPYSAKYLKGVFDRTGEYWSNHFNTIGLVGMNEACIHLFGDGIAHHKEFAEQTLEYLRDLLLQYQEETGHQYNLEATPAEGTCYSLAKKDGGQFVYYTNSTNLPVDYTDNIFTALDHQDKLQSLYTGGTVQHLYLGERIEDPKACAELIKVIFTKYKLPYISITPTFSVCEEHGYLVGNVEQCPKCGAETEVWSRVTGYLRPVKNYNTGKKQEFKERLTYNVKGGDTNG
jgi:ribonucleoside-triphosphate reductase